MDEHSSIKEKSFLADERFLEAESFMEETYQITDDKNLVKVE